MTVQELINGSLRSIGVLATGETPSASESNDAFVSLNNVAATWSAQGVPIPNISRDALALNGSASYTIGPGGAFNVTRPLRINSAAVVAGGVPVPYDIVTAEQWAAGPPPRSIFWDGGYPLGTLRFNPPPATGATLELYSFKPLAQFSTLGQVINLPSGYERALRYALAIDLASEYGRTLTPEVAANAAEAIGAITNLNRQVLGEPMPAQAPQAAQLAQ